ncbi:MAG TPA: hypothetical protein VGL23_17635 [Chloroflexota bacterium]
MANRSPQPQRLRLLFATGPATRRLFRPGDPYDRGREGPPEQRGTRTLPNRADLPERYRDLLDWYTAQYAPRTAEADPILSLRGLGKHLADGEHPDDYIRRLRQDW